MSFKTQLRYEQITGSLPNDALNATAASSINPTDFGDTLDHLASALRRLHGGSSFSEQGEGIFSVNMQVTGTLGATGLAIFDNGLTVNTAAADFNAGVTANEIKIDGDTSTRLYIVGDSGELKDEANLTFDGSELLVTGTLETTGNANIGGNLLVAGDLTVQGTTTALDTTNLLVEDNVVIIGSGINSSANANGGIAIASGSSGGDSLVFGRVDNDTFGVGVKDVEDGEVTSLADMTLTAFRASTFEVGADNGALLSPSANQLQISGSGISFLTADSDTMTAGYLTLANDGEIATFQSTFGDDTSIVAAINQAANSTSSKHIAVVGAATSAGTAVTISGLAHDGGSGGPNTVDVFLNGQLMTSGSAASNNPATDDYYIHAGTSAAPFDVSPTSGQIVFTFDLHQNDVVTVFDKV